MSANATAAATLAGLPGFHPHPSNAAAFMPNKQEKVKAAKKNALPKEGKVRAEQYCVPGPLVEPDGVFSSVLCA
jgi:hypothetical protein